MTLPNGEAPRGVVEKNIEKIGIAPWEASRETTASFPTRSVQSLGTKSLRIAAAKAARLSRLVSSLAMLPSATRLTLRLGSGPDPHWVRTEGTGGMAAGNHEKEYPPYGSLCERAVMVKSKPLERKERCSSPFILSSRLS